MSNTAFVIMGWVMVGVIVAFIVYLFSGLNWRAFTMPGSSNDFD